MREKNSNATMVFLSLAVILSNMNRIPAVGIVVYTSSNQTAISSTLELLSTSGSVLVNQDGQVVILRGVDMNTYAYKYTMGRAHSLADYNQTANWGFNVVRLEVAWNFVEPVPGEYNETYLNMADRDLGWAQSNGIYLIIDLQQNCWSPYFTTCNLYAAGGVPSWAVSSFPNNDSGRAQAMISFWQGLGPNG